jgi:hypothetical protein
VVVGAVVDVVDVVVVVSVVAVPAGRVVRGPASSLPSPQATMAAAPNIRTDRVQHRFRTASPSMARRPRSSFEPSIVKTVPPVDPEPDDPPR